METRNRKVLIVDDHPLFREGLMAIIKKQTDYELVGYCSSIKESKERLSGELPDLVTLDLSLRDGHGLELLEWIRQETPMLRVLVITMHSELELATKALDLGASGYLLKQSTGEKLLFALQQIFSEGKFIDTMISEQLMRAPKPTEAPQMPSQHLDELTHREEEIYWELVKGASTKEIAKKLFISPKTVENHRSNILKKIGVSSTMGLVRDAIKRKIIDPAHWSFLAGPHSL